MKAVFNDKLQLATLGGAEQHEGSHEGASEFAAALGMLAQEDSAAQRPPSKSALALLLGGAPVAIPNGEATGAHGIAEALPLTQSAGAPDATALTQGSTSAGSLAAIARAFGEGAACQPGVANRMPSAAEQGAPRTALFACATAAATLVAGEAGLCLPAHAAENDAEADAPTALSDAQPALAELGASAIVLAAAATCALPSAPAQVSPSAAPLDNAAQGADGSISAAALERFADSAAAQVSADPLDYLPVPVRIENLCVEAAPPDVGAQAVQLPDAPAAFAADAAPIVREGALPARGASTSEPHAAASVVAVAAPAASLPQTSTSGAAASVVEARPVPVTSEGAPTGLASSPPSTPALAPVGHGPDASLAAAKADAPQAAERPADTATARPPSSEVVLGGFVPSTEPARDASESARDASAPRTADATTAAGPEPKTALASSPRAPAADLPPPPSSRDDAELGSTRPGGGAPAAATSSAFGAASGSVAGPTSAPPSAPTTAATPTPEQTGPLPAAAASAGTAPLASGASTATGQASAAQAAQVQAEPPAVPAHAADAASPLAVTQPVAASTAQTRPAPPRMGRIEAPRAARPTGEASGGMSAAAHPFGMRSVDAAVASVIEAARFLHGGSAAHSAAAANTTAVAGGATMVFEVPSTEAAVSSAQDASKANEASEEASGPARGSLDSALASDLAGQFGGMAQHGSSGGGNMASHGDNTPAPPETPLPLPSEVQDAADAIWLRGQGPKAAAVSVQHPELGTMNLVVQQEAGRVDVRAVLETPKAAVILRAQESAIKYGLQQAGMTLSSLRVKTREETETPRARELARKRRTDGWEA
jgi:Flagellar hook-length control protein FliK